jgi:xanthine/uracil/vitamin C permease (AzgA family)
MFLAPIFASIPPYATGPAIILVRSWSLCKLSSLELQLDQPCVL